jgi:hypothetical protein
MQDADGDFRADGVRLTYSARIRHALDGDGTSPFTVAGYAIRSVDAADGKTLVIELVEGTQPDPAAAPAIRYRRTISRPVKSRVGKQAANQLFRATRPHGHAPPPPPADSDGDGIPDPQDCAPRDAAIHPGAPDLPDLSFVDSNCDGIDGTETDAVFVSPNGNDADPGTKPKPKREIQAAIDTVTAGEGRYVLAAAGSYKHVRAATGISIYGGYDPGNWSRRSAVLDTSIAGVPEGILADGATRVVLQLLSVHGQSNGFFTLSVYGIRAVNGAALTLQRVAITAASSSFPGIRGIEGSPGGDGGRGENGSDGSCGDHSGSGVGGTGGRDGSHFGSGGNGGYGGEGGDFDGATGGGVFGGPGGKNGDPGRPGGTGGDGSNGDPGRGGYRGAGIAATADGAAGGDGNGGVDGNGGSAGSGGGGGGGQEGTIHNDVGNGGGGGGGAGAGGAGGGGGEGGGGAFGVYLYNSILVVESSEITAGNGAAGGKGGNGERGGLGGARGYGGASCLSEVGRGGRGGIGGNGGAGGGGGGGAGGPSIGIFRGGTSKATVSDSAIKIGTGGAGGLGGAGGPGVLGGPNGGIGEDGKPGIAAKVYP